ncbi:DNA polymerase III subunit delta' [Thalassospira sp. MCCC 1A01428]|jgi:DNA polymerase-3 subunit delta'|uniref:DNA polymerase III subunit delta' n=1 Tax=Thalassospira sp. MCCC 1A01428 TaxID=1470575 RepID=UPI000A1E44DA|nr:DNA polymerase III subunit delta' [Thalassospira sp. MCCC 1A01428]OSQ42290.1 DNA polymerase III subunit delta' [Thalassospira sp. MCCC 1A01428]
MTEPNDDDQGYPTPRQNHQLKGHDAAEQVIVDAWNSKRMHHAWLLCGPRGVGKATLAYRMARFALSHGGENAGGGLFGDVPTSLYVSPEDPVFRRIAGGGHGDLKVIERLYDEKKKRLQGEIVVENVRAVGNFMSKTSAEGGWRVVIVDAADELNRNAANAILKVLEEPPANAMMILIAHQPGRLLPTIRSRCRRLNLGTLDDQTVSSLLAQYCPDMETDDIHALTGLSDGSIGRALQLHDVGGLELYTELVNLIATLPETDVAAQHKFAERFSPADRDEAFVTVTALLNWWLARMIRFAATGTAPREVVSGELPAMQRMAAAQPLDQWLEVWEKITDLMSATRGLHLDRKQALLNAFFMLEETIRS